MGSCCRHIRLSQSPSLWIPGSVRFVRPYIAFPKHGDTWRWKQRGKKGKGAITNQIAIAKLQPDHSTMVHGGDDAATATAAAAAAVDDDDDRHIEVPAFSTTLDKLLDAAGVVPIKVCGSSSVVIAGIQEDSRQVVPGDLFVCCKGFHVDGHSYISQAVQNGAVAVIISKDVLVPKNVQAVVQVEDTNAIISALAAAFFCNPSQKLTVVGITGTNGKTTTSYLLKGMFEALGHKVGLLGTVAYYVNANKILDNATHTTPGALQLQRLMATMVHNGSDMCVMEVSSHALALDRCKHVDFDVAVFTNLTRDHMDFHKTEQHYRESKGRLFARMVSPKQHRKVVNMDDPHASYFVSQGNDDVPLVGFSMQSQNTDVFASEMYLSSLGTRVVIDTPHGKACISSSLLGRHNVSNILTAVAVGIAVNGPLGQIIRGIEQVQAVPGRCEQISEGQNFAVLVDYAHTPDALLRLLDTIRECGAQRVLTVVGCGGDRDKGKRPMMAKIAAAGSDVCVFTSDNPRTEDPCSILNDMLRGVGISMKDFQQLQDKTIYRTLQNGCRLHVCENRSQAIKEAIAMGKEGDAVVIAGKGHETYQIIGDKITHFDDREQCREALKSVTGVRAGGFEIPMC